MSEKLSEQTLTMEEGETILSYTQKIAENIISQELKKNSFVDPIKFQNSIGDTFLLEVVKYHIRRKKLSCTFETSKNETRLHISDPYHVGKVSKKDDFTTFLSSCYEEKECVELDSEEAQLHIERFKQQVKKHILDRSIDAYSEVFFPNSHPLRVISAYLERNGVPFTVQNEGRNRRVIKVKICNPNK